MTSLRQIEANRYNALKSTGPKTEDGKQRSRRNALKHGFTAETVIEPLENPEEYRAFELLATSPATSIETGLLRMQSEILDAFRSSRQNVAKQSVGEGAPQNLAGTGAEIRQNVVHGANGDQQLHPLPRQPHAANASRDIAISFLRLANLDNDIVDRLSRYEAALWRQLAQALFTLQALKRR